MQVVTDLPFEVVETSNVQITLSDGTHLAARIWTPVGAEPVPAILEYLPYRKRDGTAARDALTHPYLAGHGYLCVRVDMRGQGESTGLWDDEYSAQELSDGLEVIDWLAQHPSCDGTVGMMGISWGGFNGLQLAARAPAPLRAVVSLCASTDRYADDIHYKGGVMLGENPGWAATALSWFSLPPDPALVGPPWRDIWLERLEATPFLLKTWTEHSARDAYWAHGSVCEDYSAIKAAVLSIGGWHDGYRNTPRRLVQHLQSPCRAIIGPWNHKYPHIAVPGPAIDILGEILRWFDQFLKGKERHCLDEPPLRLYRMDSLRPEVSLAHRPGTWVADGATPTEHQRLHFAGHRLADGPALVDRQVAWDAACGLGAGEYFPFGFGPGELPDDQRADDALSACFDSGPMAQTDITGPPLIRLRLCADQPHAQVTVRLCDLRPDGTSALISLGLFNLRYRKGHGAPEDLVPGAEIELAFALDDIAYRLPEGHRLRIAISPGYFPFAFPDPAPVTLRILGGQVDLPLGQGPELPDFDAPKSAPPQLKRQDTAPQEAKRVVHDLAAKTWSQEIRGDTGLSTDLATGLESSSQVEERFCVTENRPETASASFFWTRSLGRGDWQVRTEASVEMVAGPQAWDIRLRLRAYEGAELLFETNEEAQLART